MVKTTPLRLSMCVCISAVLVACNGSTQPDAEPAFVLQFDGIDDYVQVPDDATLDFGTGDFTWEIWLKRSRTGTREDVLTKKDVLKDSEHDLALFVEQNDRVYAFFRDHPYSGLTITISSESRLGMEWTHIAVSRSAGTVRLYINGVLEAQRAATIDVTSSGPFRIGANRLNNAAADAGPVFPFKGSVREVRVWNVARSSHDIADVTFGCVSPGVRGLVAHFRFAEGSGDVLRDATGNRNDAVLRNGPLWAGTPPLCSRD